MQAVGVVIHHSACPSINGKGYDFFICRNGKIIPAPLPVETGFLHICFEGNFTDPLTLLSPEWQEQLLVYHKLLARLRDTFSLQFMEPIAHADHCPGHLFPWSELVISSQDRYH